MGQFLLQLLPVFIHSSIEIELMSARYGGSISNNCVKKYDRYTKTLKQCCDGKFYHYFKWKSFYLYSIFSITIFLNKWYCSFSSGAICNFPGTIKLCQSCGNSNVSDTTSFNGRNCRTFFSNYYHILRSETKPWVLHDDSNLDCCWKVYSEGGYKGRSQLISGREWRKGEGWVDTKCTNVEFPIRSLTRVYKSYSELSFSEEP